MPGPAGVVVGDADLSPFFVCAPFNAVHPKSKEYQHHHGLGLERRLCVHEPAQLTPTKQNQKNEQEVQTVHDFASTAKAKGRPCVCIYLIWGVGFRVTQSTLHQGRMLLGYEQGIHAQGYQKCNFQNSQFCSYLNIKLPTLCRDPRESHLASSRRQAIFSWRGFLGPLNYLAISQCSATQQHTFGMNLCVGGYLHSV